MDEITVTIRHTSQDRITVTTHVMRPGGRVARYYNVLNGEELIDVVLRDLAGKIHHGTVGVIKVDALSPKLF